MLFYEQQKIVAVLWCQLRQTDDHSPFISNHFYILAKIVSAQAIAYFRIAACQEKETNTTYD